MTDFPVASYQFEDDPPVVTVSLDRWLSDCRGTPEWDGFTLELTPDRADEIAAALTLKAAAVRNGLIDIHATDTDDDGDVQVAQMPAPERIAPEIPRGYVLGLDGKVYPGALSRRSNRAQIVAKVHALAHDGHSIRDIVRILSGEFGLRRSVGTVHSDLNTWQCSSCSGAPKATT